MTTPNDLAALAARMQEAQADEQRELEICPDCTGAGGDNSTYVCAKCDGSGGVARPRISRASGACGG